MRLRRDVILFQNGKKKALTFSYDDGITQDERLIDLMDQYGMKGTFNINSGLFGDQDWLIQSGVRVKHFKIERENIQSIYGKHEIAVHSVTHPDLAKIPQGTAAYEIVQCRKDLEDIVKHPVTGMAYPMGTWNQNLVEAAKCCGIKYARTTRQTFEFELPDEFLEWHPTCHHTNMDKMFQLLELFLEPIEDKNYKSPKVFSVWGHTYELDAYQKWDDLEEFFKKAQAKSDVWYASNGEICDYINAAEQLEYSASGDYIFNPTCRTIWMLIDQKVRQLLPGETIVVDDSNF